MRPVCRHRAGRKPHRWWSETLCFTPSVSYFFHIHINILGKMNDIAHNPHTSGTGLSPRRRVAAVSEEVTLLVVSKTKPASDIVEAIKPLDNGHLVKIMWAKRGGKSALFRKRKWKVLHWHFIGPLQSNKKSAGGRRKEHFDWCHTIDRLRIASRLGEQRPGIICQR